MNNAFDLCSGICWSLVYVTAVIRGQKKKTWCIPKLCICLNIFWEFWAVLYEVIAGYRLDAVFCIHVAWLLLDVGVLLTWLLFDDKKKTKQNLLLLCSAAALMWLMTFKLSVWAEAAFIINAIMSIAFVIRANKPPYEWMSVFIGAMKLIGTLAATILEGIIRENFLILWVGVSCCLFDLLYIHMIIKKEKVCH